MSDTQTRLDEIAELNPTRALKKGKMTSFVEMASLPTNSRDIENIAQKEFSGSGSKFKNGDILFARITPCLENGKTAKVAGLQHDEIAHGSTEFIVLSAREPEFDEDYLYYFCRLSEFRNYAKSRMEGTSGRQRVSWQALAEFEFDFPDKEIRKKAADMLKIFDDKIQLNTQTNQTLEAIAQAIFKSWFVDFDPVRAKAQALSEGKSEREANLSVMAVISGKTIEDLSQTEYQELWEIADAFPSELVANEEFGEMPKGWELTTFGEVAECFDRKRIPLSKKQREEKQGTIPYYGATSIMDYVDEAIFDDIYLLIGEDGSVLKADGTPFIQYIWGKSWVNNHAHVLQGKNGISTEHLMTFIRTENISAYVTGAVQMKLNQANMNKIPFLKANDKVNIYFDYYLKSLYSAFRNNIEENRNLEKTRDLLLPKLLSGELFNE